MSAQRKFHEKQRSKISKKVRSVENRQMRQPLCALNMLSIVAFAATSNDFPQFNIREMQIFHNLQKTRRIHCDIPDCIDCKLEISNHRVHLSTILVK